MLNRYPIPLACLMTALLLAGCGKESTTTLVFQVDTERAVEMGLLTEGESVPAEALGRMVEVIDRRLAAMEGSRASETHLGEDGQIEVDVTGGDLALRERIEQSIVNVGLLEISRLANMVDDQDLCDLGIEASAAGNKEVVQDDILIGIWTPVAADDDGSPKEVAPLFGVQMQEFDYRGHADWPHYLVVVEPDPDWRITGDLLQRAHESLDDLGNPAVAFQFNTEGAARFQSLTTMYQPRPESGHRTSLAIILNGEIHSSPAIEAPISGGVGIIHGSFTQAEVEALVTALNSGALEYPLILHEVVEASDDGE